MPAEFDVGDEADALAVVGDRAAPVLVGVALGRRIERDAARRHPPVVEHLGDVHDLARVLGEPQQEVVVL